ncbi:hypothetical protein LVD15_11245 [Fulvivirga maritima]|uniref:hypothetical protein n=1 Tax=Fulvivirga maritima TaxID=2904247 RepID=UPI001F46613F|nr:hypothetical protein [Fulvivirga maritima]UII28972.1 hypothetical protein LVD15_11245 [Fulvivirga maritima]
MKVLNVYVLTFLIIAFFSCDNSKRRNVNQSIKQIDENSKETASQDDKHAINEILIDRLNEMKSYYENDDREGMSQFFSFPTSNFLFIRRNANFNEKLASNNFKINKEMFLKYAQITKSTEHPNLYQLLTSLNLNGLKNSSSIEKTIELENDECMYIYKIQISNNLIEISYTSNSNPKYSNEGNCQERSTFLYFEISGDRLIYQKSEIAG